MPIQFVIPHVEDRDMRIQLGSCIKEKVLENIDLKLKLIGFIKGLQSLFRICF